jgi:hypothetical protein
MAGLGEGSEGLLQIMALEDDRKAPGLHLAAERITGSKLHQGEAHGPRIACLLAPIIVRIEASSESFAYPFPQAGPSTTTASPICGRLRPETALRLPMFGENKSGSRLHRGY